MMIVIRMPVVNGYRNSRTRVIGCAVLINVAFIVTRRY